MTEDQFYLYFCGSTLITLLIATSSLVFFSKDILSKLVGLFAIKPAIAYGFGIATLFIFLGRNWIAWYVCYAVFEFCLLLAILFQFRSLYQQYFWLLCLFSLLDLARWGSVFFILASAGIFGTFSIDGNMVRIMLSRINLYSILFAFIGLVFGIIRRQKLRSTKESI